MAIHSNLGKPTRMFAVRGRKSSISSENVRVGHRHLIEKEYNTITKLNVD